MEMDQVSSNKKKSKENVNVKNKETLKINELSTTSGKLEIIVFP